jgi:LysM repeat protein
VIRNIMKAYVEGIHYYKTHPKESIAILQKYLKTDDMEALKETYEAIGLTLIPEKPYPTLRGIQMILGELGAKDPKAQAAKPEQFVDMSFMKELDTSGFIDRLYKANPAVASAGVLAPAAAKDKVVVASKSAPPAAEKAKTAPPSAKTVPASSPKGGSQEYTIQAGDTLSRLAQRHYGDALKWNRIYEANKQTLKNPNYIYIGQKVVIPGDETSGT